MLRAKTVLPPMTTANTTNRLTPTMFDRTLYNPHPVFENGVLTLVSKDKEEESFEIYCLWCDQIALWLQRQGYRTNKYVVYHLLTQEGAWTQYSPGKSTNPNEMINKVLNPDILAFTLMLDLVTSFPRMTNYDQKTLQCLIKFWLFCDRVNDEELSEFIDKHIDDIDYLVLPLRMNTLEHTCPQDIAYYEKYHRARIQNMLPYGDFDYSDDIDVFRSQVFNMYDEDDEWTDAKVTMFEEFTGLNN